MLGRCINDRQKAEDYYDKTLRDVSSHDISLLILNWTPDTQRKSVLDTAKKHGLKCIVHLDEIDACINLRVTDVEVLRAKAREELADIQRHSALAGYYLTDEPMAESGVQDSLALCRQVLAELDPKRPAFSCFLGDYEGLFSVSGLPILLTNIYSFRPADYDSVGGPEDGLSSYVLELQRSRRIADERPFWVIVQAFGKLGEWKVPTPAEIRAQVWLALAHNAKGIIYFIYQSTTSIQGECLQGLVDMDLNPTDMRWAEVGAINAEIKKLSPILLQLKPASFPLPDLPGDITAQPFVGEDGHRYIILANSCATRSSIIRWSAPSASDVLTGQRVMKRIVLSPGGGRVLRLD